MHKIVIKIYFKKKVDKYVSTTTSVQFYVYELRFNRRQSSSEVLKKTTTPISTKRF